MAGPVSASQPKRVPAQLCVGTNEQRPMHVRPKRMKAQGYVDADVSRRKRKQTLRKEDVSRL